MTRYTRRIFFYSSIAIFLLITPFLIAHSLGYTFRLGTRSVEKIGGIFIKSKTPRLSIFLDGEFIKQTSYLSGDALLTDILPGIHHLRMEKADHVPWSATITVQPALVTDLRNILLVANPPMIATSTKDELDKLHASALLGSSQSVSSELQPIRNSSQHDGQDDSMIPPKITSAQNLPLPSSLPMFFVDNKQNLIGKTATSTKIVIAHVNSFRVFDDTIYFIDKNGFLGKFDIPSQHITTIERLGFYLSEKSAQFFQTRDGSIIILDASGGLFLSDGSTNAIPLTGGVRQIAFDSTGAKILIQKDQTIDVIWLQDNVFQPFQRRGMRDQIFVSDTSIQDADWFFADDAHIVVRTPDGIFFISTDTRTLKNTVKLFDKKTDELVTIPSLPHAIFFRRGEIIKTILL